MFTALASKLWQRRNRLVCVRVRESDQAQATTRSEWSRAFDIVKSWWLRKPNRRRNQCQGRVGVESLEPRECLTSYLSYDQALNAQAYGQALNAQVAADINRFVQDAATVESARPTLYSRAIINDLVRINHHNRNGNLPQAFAAFQELGSHLALEARVTANYRLPKSSSLLSYGAIVSDLVRVGNGKALMVAFNQYLSTHPTYQSTVPVQDMSFLSGGLFASGTIGGNLQRILGQQQANAQMNYRGPSVGSTDHYLNSIAGQNAADAFFSSISTRF